jgi:hypothetical protein
MKTKLRWSSRVDMAPSEVTVRQMTEAELAGMVNRKRTALLGGTVSTPEYAADREALLASMPVRMTDDRWNKVKGSRA